MEQNATEQIKKRIAELPPDVLAAVQRADLGEKVRTIGESRRLHIDQIGELEEEVQLAMLGFVPLENFGNRLAEVLHISAAEGNALAADVGKEIFAPIRESIKHFAAQRALAEATKAPPVPAQSPAPPPLASATNDLHVAEKVLNEKTISLAPQKAPVEKPIYKADPYREPF